MRYIARAETSSIPRANYSRRSNHWGNNWSKWKERLRIEYRNICHTKQRNNKRKFFGQIWISNKYRESRSLTISRALVSRFTSAYRECPEVRRGSQSSVIFRCVHSRQFGFLKLNSPEQTKKKALVVRAIKYLERMLVQAQAEKQRRKADSTKSSPDDSKENDDEDKGISIDPKTYCKLGHFHLLLEDYTKGIAWNTVCNFNTHAWQYCKQYCNRLQILQAIWTAIMYRFFYNRNSGEVNNFSMIIFQAYS